MSNKFYIRPVYKFTTLFFIPILIIFIFLTLFLFFGSLDYTIELFLSGSDNYLEFLVLPLIWSVLFAVLRFMILQLLHSFAILSLKKGEYFLEKNDDFIRFKTFRGYKKIFLKDVFSINSSEWGNSYNNQISINIKHINQNKKKTTRIFVNGLYNPKSEVVKLLDEIKF